jgi:hypothetical protein
MAVDQTIESLTSFVKGLIQKDRGSWSNVVQGTFTAAEANDSNLSSVVVLGITLRFVRKLASVGTMSAGQQVLILKGGGIPATIIGVVVGNITRTGV